MGWVQTNMGTDGKFSNVSLRASQELQETFRLSPSFKFEKKNWRESEGSITAESLTDIGR
jgi:hypothetical protein